MTVNDALKASRRSVLVAQLLCILAPLTLPNGLYAEDASTVLELALARAEAVVSGRMTYTFTFVPYNKSTRRFVPDEPQKFQFAFQGDSWRLAFITLQYTLVNHAGFLLEHRIRPGDDLHPESASMQPAVALYDIVYDNRPPFFGGAFWMRFQLEFVQAHRDRGQLRPDSAIDGTTCKVVDLPVGPDEVRAFQFLHSLLRNGGTLRLYIATGFGYAISRIENLTPRGTVLVRFNAADFREDAPSIFFPRKIWREVYDDVEPSPPPEAIVKYDIDQVELLNQPIPETEFVINLPVGTSVSDARTKGHGVGFYLKAPAESNELVALRDAEFPPARKLVRRNWRGVFVVGAVVAIMLLTASLLVVRRARYAE